MSRRSSYAQLAEKRYIPTRTSTKSVTTKQQQQQRPSSAVKSVADKCQSELIEHLKAQCKKYKNKCEILLKEKSIIDDRFSHNLVKSEEWKMKFRANELNFNHFQTKMKNEMKEIKMSHQREICRINLISENKLCAIQNKLDQQQQLVKKLQNINCDQSMNLESVQNKYDEAKTYQSSLENKLESSMKRALEVQESLSERLNNVQSDSSQNKNKFQNDLDRVNNLLSIKESDIKFLRTQLNNERDANHKKMNQKQANHQKQIEHLQTEICSLSKELQCTERQREEFARNSQICSDSLNKALSEYSSERESLSRLHIIEMQRKNSENTEFKKTIERQQDRLHKLMEKTKKNEAELNKLKQIQRSLKNDLSQSEAANLRLSEEAKTTNLNKCELMKNVKKLDKMNEILRRKLDNSESDLSIMTLQRDEYKNECNKFKYGMSEMEMNKNKFLIKSETALEMNEALKLELDNLRKNSVSMEKYMESTTKCKKLSSDLSDCYTNIEKLSFSLDSTRCDLNKLSSQSIPMTAYEHLSSNVNKLENENIALNKRLMEVQRLKNDFESELNDKQMAINSYECTQIMLKKQAKSFKKSMNELAKTNQQINGQRKDLKKKYKKIKNNLDDLSKSTQINQDLVRSNKFLRSEMSKLVNQKSVRLSRECANPRCNSSKGTYLKIHPKTLNALKKACNF